MEWCSGRAGCTQQRRQCPLLIVDDTIEHGSTLDRAAPRTDCGRHGARLLQLLMGAAVLEGDVLPQDPVLAEKGM